MTSTNECVRCGHAFSNSYGSEVGTANGVAWYCFECQNNQPTPHPATRGPVTMADGSIIWPDDFINGLTPNRRREGRRLARMNAEKALVEFQPDSAAGLMARATLEALDATAGEVS